MISVIIPIYNTYEYLPRCIDSVLNQTYRDFEILVIDDGSTDMSPAVCDKYATLDDRVKVFHKKNGGLSDARNYALDRIKGEYVTFIDSDDYVAPTYLEILYSSIIMNEVDFSTVAMEYIVSEKTYSIFVNKCEIMQGEQILISMLRRNEMTWSACAKLYKKKVFDIIRFPKNMYYEDLLTIPYIINSKTKVAYNTSKQYYYCARENSIMNTFSDRKARMWLYGWKKLMRHLRKSYPIAYRYSESAFIEGVFRVLVDWKLFRKDYIPFCLDIKRRYNASFRKSLFLPGLSINERIKGTLFYINVLLYKKVRITWIMIGNNHYNDRFI